MAPDPSTMLAAVVEHFGQPYSMKMIQRPPSPTGKDILVKVLAASYCHTDAVFASGGLSQDLPRIGCHEFAGIVISLGPHVDPNTTGINVGTMVGVPGRAYQPCGVCIECAHPGQDQLGYSPYCPKAGNLGLTRDGGFQEYCLVDSRQVAPLPAGLNATQAAPLMCAGLTIWSALNQPKVKGVSRVAIIGAGGGLGHIGVQFAACLGKDVLAIDTNDRAIELLSRIKDRMGNLGSRITVANAQSTDADELKSIGQSVTSDTPGTEIGWDAVILLPESQIAFDLGMKILRNHGVMVVVSFPKDKIAVSAHDLVFRDINVIGSLVGRNHQLRDMLAFFTENKLLVEVETFPFQGLNELVERSHKQTAGKLVVDMML